MDRKELLKIRHVLEKAAKEMGANWHGAGVELATEIADFSFDFKNKNYSVLIKEI